MFFPFVAKQLIQPDDSPVTSSQLQQLQIQLQEKDQKIMQLEGDLEKKAVALEGINQQLEAQREVQNASVADGDRTEDLFREVSLFAIAAFTYQHDANNNIFARGKESHWVKAFA